ncbi:MAG: hypothetical protein K6G88_13675 [Lachnospiraceae bacterium]|nr:hypothetical protein [Lachnospiraceae bacterium]
MQYVEKTIYTKEELLNEIANLKKQLEHEKERHRHWKGLAMVFHDSLWEVMGGKPERV